ncbi:MAG: hypothetical protein ACO3H5_07810, partial [Candidatus Nanopelagicales bacterium]
MANRIKELKKSVLETVESFGKFVKEQTDTRSLVQKNADAFADMDAKMKNTKLSSDDLIASFREFTSTVQQNFSEALSNARTQLQDAKNAFNEFKDVISTSIRRIVNFEKAVEGGDFLKGLIEQAENATKFSDKVKKLIEMGLSQSAITQIVEAGFEAGSTIADQIIAGGTTVVNQVNTLVSSVETVAEAVGYLGAQKFYQAGIDQANSLVNGIIDQMNTRYSDIQAMIDKLNLLIEQKVKLEQLLAEPPKGPSGGGKPKIVTDEGKLETKLSTSIINPKFPTISAANLMKGGSAAINPNTINPRFPTITAQNIMGRVIPKLATGGV